MHTLALEWQAVWKILLTSLLLGAGLPTLFATGVRALALETGSGPDSGPHPAGRALAYLCFAIIVLVVSLGIVMIVASGFGKALDFSHVYPMLKDK